MGNNVNEYKADLKRICDHCYHILEEDEHMFGFKLIDDYEYVRVFKGHETCVQEMGDIIRENYLARSRRDKED